MLITAEYAEHKNDCFILDLLRIMVLNGRYCLSENAAAKSHIN